jgi:hypothetical protein
MDYYKQVLHLSLEKFSQPDLAKIGTYIHTTLSTSNSSITF